MSKPPRSPKTFAIGDVHGYLTALQMLIEHINPQADDTLIFLGDVIDRGEDSKGVIDLILALKNRCNVLCIQGNHEEMLLTATYCSSTRNMWLYHGGEATLASFGLKPNKIGLAQLPERYLQFFREMLPYVETERYIFSHATPLMFMPMNEQGREGLRWATFSPTQQYRHISGKMVVCGHTSQDNGIPWIDKHIAAIDTYICGDKWLTALDMESYTVHQANRRGEYRCD
ncbi:MAG: serine/threonine protein phosphatase [Gammaproteobacteria bacterium]|nr:serine/threonine protein phosphatase [Gammaproteobacteria bacterium]